MASGTELEEPLERLSCLRAVAGEIVIGMRPGQEPMIVIESYVVPIEGEDLTRIRAPLAYSLKDAESIALTILSAIRSITQGEVACGD